MKPEFDVGHVAPRRATLRCGEHGHDLYEVRFEVACRGEPAGASQRLHVVRSSDCGATWDELGFKRQRSQWWAVFNTGLGGSQWPPAPEHVRDAYVKEGDFTIQYGNPFELGPQGEFFIWEMQYNAHRQRWRLSQFDLVPGAARARHQPAHHPIAPHLEPVP